MSDLLSTRAEAYLHHLEHIRGASPNTLRSYSGDLERFLAFLTEYYGRRPTVEDFAVPAIRAFLSARHDEVSAASIARTLYTIRSFANHLVKRRVLTQSPALLVRTPKRVKSLPERLSADDMARLLGAVPPDGPAGARDHAALATLYCSGARVEELCALNCEDISEEGTIRIRRGKGSKERITFLGAAAQQALERYLRVRPLFADPVSGLQDEHAVFLSTRGHRLTSRSVARLILSAGQRAGIRVAMHPHIARHACAGHLRDGGADLPHLQMLLGHSSMETTAHYCGLSLDRLVASHTKHHPHGR